MSKMIYSTKTNSFKCPKCGGTNIYVKSGMLLDLYICNECGFESRNIKFEK